MISACGERTSYFLKPPPYNPPESRQRNNLPCENQERGQRGAVVHQEAIGGASCPVAALARRIHNIRGTSQACPISMVFHHDNKQPTRGSDRDITIAVRWGAMNDNRLERGYALDRVSSPSLRAGGAMALKLAGATTDTIMRMGRWTSNTYMTYINAQICALAKGLAWRCQVNTRFTT
jgi:hypothetical protein